MSGNGHDNPAIVRPRLGSITRANGTEIPVRFEPAPEPNTFLPVDLDGRPVVIRTGDRLNVDVIGPGQSISATVAFRCPVCGAESHHPTDIAEGYCARCHDWTGRRP